MSASLEPRIFGSRSSAAKAGDVTLIIKDASPQLKTCHHGFSHSYVALNC